MVIQQVVEFRFNVQRSGHARLRQISSDGTSPNQCNDDRFGLAKPPRGISGIGSDQRGDIVPERHVSVTPLGGAIEALALSPRHVIADQVQRSDGHTGRLHRPAHDPLAVHEGQVLPDSRQWLSGQVLNRK